MSPQCIENFAPQPMNQPFYHEHELDRAFWFAEEPSPFTLAMIRRSSYAGRQCAKKMGRNDGHPALAHERLARCAALERQALELQAEKSRQLAELTEKNRQLQEINRVCSAYIADVAHELRNSLLTLNFYVGLLANGRSDKQEHYQRMALQSVEQLRQFVEDTLSLSRLEVAGAQRGEMQPVDLNEMIGEIVLLHQAQAEAAGLRLTFEPSVGVALVVGDRLLLSQVIINLVTNAVKYTQAGWIGVRTELLPETNEVVLDVVDSGIGIAPNDLRYIFERFYRAQDEQIETIPGTGLGLAIVKEIVNQHQGEIAVESTAGVGSHFRVRLPGASVV